MPTRPISRLITDSHRGPAGVRAGHSNRLGIAAASCASAWRAMRGTAAVVAVLALAFGGISAMLWLFYELASWWIQFAAHPFPGAGTGLEDLIR